VITISRFRRVQHHVAQAQSIHLTPRPLDILIWVVVSSVRARTFPPLRRPADPKNTGEPSEISDAANTLFAAADPRRWLLVRPDDH